MRDAVQSEDFLKAAALSDELANRLWAGNLPLDDKEKRARRKKMTWKGLGAAPWLVDRLDALNYTFPTTIQINAMQSVNAILNVNDNEEEEEIPSLEERIQSCGNGNDMGIVISGTTGAGKTLAYLVPLLSTLSDSFFVRQRVRVGAEERVVGDTTDDLLNRVALVTSPQIRSNARKQIFRKNGPIATGAAISTLGNSGGDGDVKDPLALIVVPTRELGIQTALLLYELVGGKVKTDATEFTGKANMFKYKGPKGIKIGCILDEKESEYGLKLQTDVAITTPAYLTKLIADSDIRPSKLRVVIYDEADLALELTKAKDLDALFNDNPEERALLSGSSSSSSRLTFLVGASVTESLGNLAVKSRVLPNERSYISTATKFMALESELTPNADSNSNDANDSENGTNGGSFTMQSLVGSNKADTASLKDLGVCLDPGLKHERVIVGSTDKNAGLLVLARLLRKELRNYEEAVALAAANNSTTATEIQRPRVVVFFPSEDEAKASTETVRDAIWGDHQLCVLLPKTGIRPLSMMEQFKNGKMSVMLATPNSVRGLDFPALTTVYTLYLPALDDPREYVHLAGRVGRVGQMGSVLGGGGRVVSIVKEQDAENMEGLAKELGFEFETLISAEADDSIKRTEAGDVDMSENNLEDIRRYLEDTVSLLDLAEESSSASTPVNDESVINIVSIADNKDENCDGEDNGDAEKNIL